MHFFIQPIKKYFNTTLKNTNAFKLIILWGEKGNGKTFTAHSILHENNIKTKDIILSEENIIFFDIFEPISPAIPDEDSILIECSRLFEKDYCLFFQNMEFCDLDSKRILYRLLKYHKNNDLKACIILEYNVLTEPDDILCSLAKDFLFVGNPSKDNFYKYYMAYFAPTLANQDLFEKILRITNGNIYNFLTTLNILQYMNVLRLFLNKYIALLFRESIIIMTVLKSILNCYVKKDVSY